MVWITTSGLFPVTALITETLRQLDLRRQFHWTRIRAGKMRQEEAVRRTALMVAIVRHLTVTATVVPGTRLRSTKQIGRRVWNGLPHSKQSKQAPRD
jgi:hypothetical protein